MEVESFDPSFIILSDKTTEELQEELKSLESEITEANRRKRMLEDRYETERLRLEFEIKKLEEQQNAEKQILIQNFNEQFEQMNEKFQNEKERLVSGIRDAEQSRCVFKNIRGESLSDHREVIKLELQSKLADEVISRSLNLKEKVNSKNQTKIRSEIEAMRLKSIDIKNQCVKKIIETQSRMEELTQNFRKGERERQEKIEKYHREIENRRNQLILESIAFQKQIQKEVDNFNEEIVSIDSRNKIFSNLLSKVNFRNQREIETLKKNIEFYEESIKKAQEEDYPFISPDQYQKFLDELMKLEADVEMTKKEISRLKMSNESMRRERAKSINYFLRGSARRFLFKI